MVHVVKEESFSAFTSNLIWKNESKERLKATNWHQSLSDVREILYQTYKCGGTYNKQTLSGEHQSNIHNVSCGKWHWMIVCLRLDPLLLLLHVVFAFWYKHWCCLSVVLLQIYFGLALLRPCRWKLQEFQGINIHASWLIGFCFLT